MDRKPRIPNGFTLVELLVVIAIIAILFAVILIAINPAQRFKDSRNARRLSDVQSIAGATTTYTTDKRGTLPADIPDGQCIGTKIQAPLSDGGYSPPVGGYWKFDNNLNDENTIYNGISSDQFIANAKFNQGLDIQNGFIISDTIDDSLSDGLTLEGWIKLNDKNEPGYFDHHQSLFDKGNFRMQLNSDSGKLEFEIQRVSVVPSLSWNEEYNASSAADTIKGINAIAQFQGNLYAGATDMADQGKVLKKNGTGWSIIPGYPAGSKSIDALVSYKGKLYSGQESTDGKAYVYSFDGTSWQDTSLKNNGVLMDGDVLALARYRGKLYAGISGVLSGASIWAYDGNSWILSRQFLSTEAYSVYSLALFNGKLYAGTGRSSDLPSHQNARVFEFDGASWVEKFNPSDLNNKDAVYSLGVYNKKLYIGLGGNDTGNDGEVREWDGIGAGANQIGVANPIMQRVMSLGVFNGYLYAGWGNSASGQICRWSGAWWDQCNLNIYNEVRYLNSFGGKFYAATRGDATTDATIQQYGDSVFAESNKSAWIPNVWYHVLGAYNSSNNNINLIVNGSVDYSGTASTVNPLFPSDNDKSMYLGSGYSSDAFYGVIDDFALSKGYPSPMEDLQDHAGCYNLGQYLAPEYMGSLPIDPSSAVTDGTDTGYFISKDTGGVITITAPLTETTSSVPEIIKASR